MKRPKRAYIGNLRPRPDLERKLYRELFLPFCLSVRNFTDGHEHGHDSGGGIVVVWPKLRSVTRHDDGESNSPSKNAYTNANANPANNCYALVEFTDVEYAIQMLNGVQFDGRTLRVDREKRTMDAAAGGGFGSGWNGGGFGSGRWIGGGGGRGGGRGGARGRVRGRGNRNDDNYVNGSNGDATFQNTETSEPNPPTMTTGKYNRDEDREEAIARRVGEAIASQIDESSDPVGTAIAGTAAVTFLASVDAFGLDGGDVTDTDTDPDTGTASIDNDSDNNNANSVDVALDGKARDQSNDKLQGKTILTDDDFQKRRQLSMTELLAEYGEEDPNWKKQSYPTIPKHGGKEKDVREDDDDDATSGTNVDVDYGQRRNMPLADLLAEYGERDADWKKRQQPPQLSSPIATTASNTVNGDETSTRTINSSRNQSHNHKNTINHNNHKNNDHTQNHKQGMLAPSNKSSIHVEILSFGYKYGAPPKRDKSFDYAHPLPPWDVRDLEKAPADIAKFHGLSHWVKRALLNPGGRGGGDVHDDDGDGDDDNNNDDDNGDDNTATNNNHRKQNKEPSPMRKRANEMADEIIRTIVESIDEGGHGPISPLNMTISIGSEYGRHRSVVLAEHLAVVLRARLRRNDGRRFGESDGGNGNGNGIVTQLVSVGTRHRDLDARHVDEEAFGNKREARAMEKARKRQMDLEWGDDHW